jgi:hypothetical protein
MVHEGFQPVKTSGPRLGDREPNERRLRVSRILLTAAAAVLVCWLLGWATQAVILAALPAADTCWRPGDARNIGVTEQPCP